jgi:thiol-disulfide isomerase/thioredoxin
VNRKTVTALLVATIVAAVLGVGLGALAGKHGLGRGRLSQRAFDEMNAGARPGGAPMVTIGQAVPVFRLETLAGQPPATLPATGRPMLINYWASWCGPCRREMPALSAYAEGQGANGVQVVGIALDDAAGAQAFLKRRPTAFAHLVEEPADGDSSARLGNLRGVLPFTVLLDAQGRLQHRHIGAFEDDGAIADWVAEAAEAPAAAPSTRTADATR